jgi:hypothetical protein
VRAAAPSTLQSLFVLLLFPITTALAGVNLSSVPSYLARGTEALLASLWLPLTYVTVNCIFNCAALLLLRWV